MPSISPLTVGYMRPGRKSARGLGSEGRLEYPAGWGGPCSAFPQGGPLGECRFRKWGFESQGGVVYAFNFASDRRLHAAPCANRLAGWGPRAGSNIRRG